MKKFKNKLSLILLLTALSGTVNAQVTIGSDIEPVKGAILDLKQTQTNDGSANSALGMMLPRVKLTKLDKLSGGAAITGVDNNSETDKSSYTGLTVYNVGYCRGVYVWSGSLWEKLGQPCPPPPLVYGKWAGSNVYFVKTADASGDGITDGEVGYLTFDEHKGDKEGYQGLFFRWGSLVGVAAGGNGAYSNSDTYLYIPDKTSGIYYKVKSGQIAGVSGTGTPIGAAVSAYKLQATNGDWGSIPYANNTDVDTSGRGRGDNRLTTNTGTLKATYKGDICKFLTMTKATNGNSFKYSWRMPISNEFSMGDTPVPSYDTTGFSSTDPDGTGNNTVALYTYTYTGAGPLNPTETVVFPAAGQRLSPTGEVKDRDLTGTCWSSSNQAAASAYAVYFAVHLVVNFLLGYDKEKGDSVRCVQE